MKLIFLFICCTMLLGNTSIYPKVDSFYLLMTSVPVGKKTLVSNVIYKDGKFDYIQKKLVRSKCALKNIDNNSLLIGKIADSLQIIDFRTDTVYMLITYYIPTSSISMEMKTQKGVFVVIHNASGVCGIVNDSDFLDLSKDDNNDSLLYQAVFSWDIDMLIQLIKSSAGLLGSEYYLSAIRIIVNDNKVISKEIVNFEPAFRWRL